MFFQYDTLFPEQQTAEEESQWWAEQLETYLAPYRERLDAYLDRRVVGNLMAAVAGIVQTRAPLTTSELGSTICGPAHAEAGTQGLHRALQHQGWQAEVIEARHLGQQCAGEARKRETGRIGGRAFQSGAPAGPQPQRDVQSAQWHRICTFTQR